MIRVSYRASFSYMLRHPWQLALALRWLVGSSTGRRGQPMSKAMGAEVMDAYRNQGQVVRKRDDTHKMAQANKAFAHFAW